jgi:hypothetical protein
MKPSSQAVAGLLNEAMLLSSRDINVLINRFSTCTEQSSRNTVLVRGADKGLCTGYISMFPM